VGHTSTRVVSVLCHKIPDRIPDGMAGGDGFEFVFTLVLRGGSITLLKVPAEYREGAPCSARTGERGDLRLPDAKESQTLLRQRGSAFHHL
jgi:hypothetical protein